MNKKAILLAESVNWSLSYPLICIFFDNKIKLIIGKARRVEGSQFQNEIFCGYI